MFYALHFTLFGFYSGVFPSAGGVWRRIVAKPLAGLGSTQSSHRFFRSSTVGIYLFGKKVIASSYYTCTYIFTLHSIRLAPKLAFDFRLYSPLPTGNVSRPERVLRARFYFVRILQWRIPVCRRGMAPNRRKALRWASEHAA